ncbi:hypothetical protein Hanom_Chr13g01191321 [Helianthus anomalus]
MYRRKLGRRKWRMKMRKKLGFWQRRRRKQPSPIYGSDCGRRLCCPWWWRRFTVVEG